MFQEIFPGEFHCQHGDKECAANQMLTCANNVTSDPCITMNFTRCVMEKLQGVRGGLLVRERERERERERKRKRKRESARERERVYDIICKTIKFFFVDIFLVYCPYLFIFFLYLLCTTSETTVTIYQYNNI